MPQQQSNDVEDLRLHRHGTVRTADLESVEVHGVTASEKPHPLILAAAVSSRSTRPAGGLPTGRRHCRRCDLPLAFGDLLEIDIAPVGSDEARPQRKVAVKPFERS